MDRTWSGGQERPSALDGRLGKAGCPSQWETHGSDPLRRATTGAGEVQSHTSGKAAGSRGDVGVPRPSRRDSLDEPRRDVAPEVTDPPPPPPHDGWHPPTRPRDARWKRRAGGTEQGGNSARLCQSRRGSASEEGWRGAKTGYFPEPKCCKEPLSRWAGTASVPPTPTQALARPRSRGEEQQSPGAAGDTGREWNAQPFSFGTPEKKTQPRSSKCFPPASAPARGGGHLARYRSITQVCALPPLRSSQFPAGQRVRIRPVPSTASPRSSLAYPPLAPYPSERGIRVTSPPCSRQPQRYALVNRPYPKIKERPEGSFSRRGRTAESVAKARSHQRGAATGPAPGGTGAKRFFYGI